MRQGLRVVMHAPDPRPYDPEAPCANCGHLRCFHQGPNEGCIKGIYSLTDKVCNCGKFQHAEPNHAA